MPLTRSITPGEIMLAEHMATNPESPATIRAFHAARLAGLRAEVAREKAPARVNPFERFIEKLQTKETP